MPDPSRLRHGRAAVNGVRLHYVEAGEGPLVLFLHGFPEFWYAWRHQIADLAPLARAVAVDTRGVNLSSGPQEVDGYRIDELVEDVRQFVRHLGAERVVLVGHDWGGFIAWETAIRHPALVDRLVIVNCAHPAVMQHLLAHDPAQAKASAYMLAFRSSRGEELVERDGFAGFRANILEPGLAAGHLTAEDAAAYLEAWRRPGGLSAGLDYYRANKLGPPSGDDAPPRSFAETRVRAPTLVLWGERDPYFVPANLDLLPQVVPELTVRRYPDNDHWIVHQMPHEVSRQIARFAFPDAP